MIASPARPPVWRALVFLISILAVSLALAQAPATARDDADRATYSPPLGAVFSSPLDGNGREILRQVYQSIQASPKGSTIRLVVWNYDDPAITTALIAAKNRGVRVQVVVAESVRNGQWRRLSAALAKDPTTRASRSAVTTRAGPTASSCTRRSSCSARPASAGT